MLSDRRCVFGIVVFSLLIAVTAVAPAEDAGAVQSRPELSGLNFILPLQADLLDMAVLPNGEWWLWQGLPDRSVLIESRRLPAVTDGRAAVDHHIRHEWPLARDIAVEPFPELARATSYPALKASFMEGEGANARQFTAALVMADEWSFWFVLKANAEASSDGENARRRGEMERRLLGIETVDPGQSDFPPAYDVPLYPSGDDSGFCMSVMDGLVRIKKLAGPESSPWLGSGRVAYRYDGPGTVLGKTAMLFSFGADTPEKFTAERHFAVGEDGAVYEMDILAGGEYWRWEDHGINWWGSYRRDDTVLFIHHYREGPSGMYFAFQFIVDGDDVFDGVAPTRGRRAEYGPLRFSLAEDDASVAVGVIPERSEEWELADFFPMEGEYSRE